MGSNGNGGAWNKSMPLQGVREVIRKLNDGTYPRVPTMCFCGCEPNDTTLVEFDRYTIPHRMVMCEECLLIRANPRMTEDAYRQFYNTEYRQIYDGFPHGPKSEDDGYLFDQQVLRGTEIKKFLAALDIAPESVIDIGSDKGGTLEAFKGEDVTVQGIEWCERGRSYAESRGISTLSSIDVAIEKGLTADLVILQDIIEHFMDLREMEKIPKLLNERGCVFLYTPGFLAADPLMHFQNAHTFQFIAATLEYVMNQMGFLAEFLDDRIVSIWNYEKKLAYPLPPPVNWRRYIMEHLHQTERRALPPVRTRCLFTEKEMLANMDANLRHHLPTLTELKDKYSGPVVVIGGGPSVDGQIDKIKELVGQGSKLVVIERMYPWCHEQGLRPDFVVALDASDNIDDGFTHLQPGVKHLLAATIKPTVFDALKDTEVFLWAGAAGSFKNAQEYWSKHGYDHVIIVNSGSTVVLASVFIPLVMGFRNIHLFGFDCMVSKDESADDYASGISGQSTKREYFEVEVGDESEVVRTCSSFLAFAQQFFRMIETARKWKMIDSIDVYGESLVNKMAVVNPLKTDIEERVNG